MSTRLLVLGTGPLFEQGSTVMSGQCLRTWHFCRPLIEAGYRVRLITVPIPGANEEDSPEAVRPATYQDFDYLRLVTNNESRILPVLQAEIREFQPNALVGVNQWPAWLLARLGSDLPLWADLNGWTLGEGLVRATALGHDEDYPHFWRMESLVALRADAFSTVTQRQAWALEGELALLGRIDHTNSDRSLASVVPNAVYPDYENLPRARGVPSFLAGRLPADAAVALWSGGFNSWTNIELLVEALRVAFERAPTLHFVATGGPIIGHDERTWQRWESLSREKLPAQRVHALGWIDQQGVLELHRCATVGLNVDGENIETRFGARNRLTNMLGAGVPVLTTRGTEIAEWIERGGHGEVVAAESALPFAEALVASATDAERWEARARTARQAALRDFSAPRTLHRFLQWVANPARSPQAPGGPPLRIRQWMESQAANPLPFQPPPPDTLRRKVARRLRRLLG